jgi:S-formylglutathione hydrolase FrmB
LDFTRQSAMGHSGGGHAAMQFHLLKPDVYRSASGIAPYCDLMRSEIGQYAVPKMFEGGFEEFVLENVPDLIKRLDRGEKTKQTINVLVSIVSQ